MPSDEEVLAGFDYGEDPSDDVSDVDLATAPALVQPLLEAGRGTGSASDAVAEIAELARGAAAAGNQNPADGQVLPGDSIVPSCG